MRLYATENGPSLSHHGIRGQKWGVRRYQNEDGSLTSAGKKRYDVNNASDRKKLSKQYSDYSKKAQANINKKANRMYVDAYNETADMYNERLKTYQPRPGKEEKQFLKEMTEDVNKAYATKYVSTLRKDKYYKKAQALCDEYGMAEWDDLAKENARDEAEVLKRYGLK